MMRAKERLFYIGILALSVFVWVVAIYLLIRG